MKKTPSRRPAPPKRRARPAAKAPRSAKPARPAAASPAPARTRKATNLTLSGQAKAMGRILAEARGMNFSQLVEQLVRDEMRRNPSDL
jgi:hypothetical protein